MKIIIISLIFFSCSNLKNSHDVSIVDLEREKTARISIDDKVDESLVVETSENISETKVTIQLYSTIYHSLGVLKLFKNLEQEKIEIESISTFGFGALIAGLYAKEGSINYLEWKLFDLLKRIKGIEPFSNTWEKIIHRFIEKEFKGLDFQKLKFDLLIPKLIGEKVVLNDKSLIESLKTTLSISSLENYIYNPVNYMARLRERGLKLVFPIIFIPENPTIQMRNNYNYGIFTSYLGKLFRNIDQVTKLTTLESVSLDSLDSTNKYESLYSKSLQSYIESMKEKINEFQFEKLNQERLNE